MIHNTFIPQKSLGQNWLVNPHILDKIITTAEINKNDIVVEIGPGLGNLSKKLAQRASKVIAVEKDSRLINDLRILFKDSDNIDILEADALKFDLQKYLSHTTYYIPHATSYKIVANIPYYITSNFLRTIFEEWPQPKLIVLTIQKEVAQRIMAKPPHTNLLALSVQYYSEPEIISYVSRNNFRPVPKVDSAIIRLKPYYHEHHGRHSAHGKKLFELMRAGFSEKRKQLAPILSKKLKLEKEKVLDAFQKSSIAPTARAENLSLEQWQELTNLLIYPLKGTQERFAHSAN